MERNRAWRRKKDYSKAARKKNIVKAYGCDYPWYPHDGQYIKGKIHCSCLMCSCKTNGRGRYGPPVNYSHADQKKVDALDRKIAEYEEGDIV